MYEEFFGLREKPFSLPPDPNYLYLSRQHRLAMVHLTYGLDNKTGFIVVTGEIGTGKTLLIKRLIRGLTKKNVVATVFNTTVGPEEFLEMVMDDFEIPHQGLSHAQKIERIHEFLINCYARHQNCILIVDEAQNLGIDTLEEIRLISNLQTEKEFLLSIVLVGQPDLKRKLLDPRLSQLAQRISVHFHLDPMSKAETKAYILHRLQKAGADDPQKVLAAEAIELVYHYTKGVPRLINLLCDAALVNAFADQRRPATREHVEEVVKEGGGGGFWQLAVQADLDETMKLRDGEGIRGADNHLEQRLEMVEKEVREISQNLIALNKALLEGVCGGQRRNGQEKTMDDELNRLQNLLNEERIKREALMKERDTLRRQVEELKYALKKVGQISDAKGQSGHSSPANTGLLKKLFKR